MLPGDLRKDPHMTTEVRAWLAQMWTRRNLERVVLLIIIGVIVVPTIWHISHQQPDYKVHGQIALRLERSGFPGDIPHFLYHLLVVFAKQVWPAGRLSAWIVLAPLASLILLAFLVYELLWRRVRDTPWQALALPLAILFFLLEPIMIDGQAPFWLGYIHVNIYHNPTYILLKLFALPVSLYALQAIAPVGSQAPGERVRDVLIAATLVVLMSLAKPSYIIALLPALALVTVYRWYKGRRIDWWLLLAGIVAPALLLLVIQYMIAYAAGDSAGLAFGPFQTLFTWEIRYQLTPDGTPTTMVLFALLRVVLSSLFPLAVALLFFRRAFRDPYLVLAWMTYGTGLFMAFMLFESGPRMSHGNFFWSAYIALFVLMFASLRFVLDRYRYTSWAQLRQRVSWRLLIIGGVFLLQALAGIWYIVQLMAWRYPLVRA
jgi:hypothetical protein